MNNQPVVATADVAASSCSSNLGASDIPKSNHTLSVAVPKDHQILFKEPNVVVQATISFVADTAQPLVVALHPEASKDQSTDIVLFSGNFDIAKSEAVARVIHHVNGEEVGILTINPALHDTTGEDDCASDGQTDSGVQSAGGPISALKRLAQLDSAGSSCMDLTLSDIQGISSKPLHSVEESAPAQAPADKKADAASADASGAKEVQDQASAAPVTADDQLQEAEKEATSSVDATIDDEPGTSASADPALAASSTTADPQPVAAPSTGDNVTAISDKPNTGEDQASDSASAPTGTAALTEQTATARVEEKTDAASAADVTTIDTQDLQTKSDNQQDAVVAVADSGSAPAEVHVSDTVSAGNDPSLDGPTKSEDLAAMEEPAPKSESATIPDVVVQDQPANDSKEPFESNADTQKPETSVAVETDAVEDDKPIEHECAKTNEPTTTEDAVVICKTENPLALEESPAEAVSEDELVSEQFAVDSLPSKDQPSAPLALATEESALEQPEAKDTINASVVADETPALDSAIDEDSVAQNPVEETKADVLDAAVAEPDVAKKPNADAFAKVVVDEEHTVGPAPEVESAVAGSPDEQLDAESAIVNPQTNDLPVDANESATAEQSVEEPTEKDKP
ncbi:hypothetical protein GGH99_007498, partial [Coemansia sp. RSA 1285]